MPGTHSPRTYLSGLNCCRLTRLEHLFSILNVRSTTKADEDLTTSAQIRDAAITCYTEHGVAATTARKVATAAGVSPGLVIHHFGSMNGLREACDHHVAKLIREEKLAAIVQGEEFDPLAALATATAHRYTGYLAAVLIDGSDAVARLVDELVSDAEDYLAEAEADGHVRPTDSPRERAAILILWALGPVVLQHHTRRLLGVDVTDLEGTDRSAVSTYAAATYDLLGSGLFTPQFATHLTNSVKKEQP